MQVAALQRNARYQKRYGIATFGLIHWLFAGHQNDLPQPAAQAPSSSTTPSHLCRLLVLLLGCGLLLFNPFVRPGHAIAPLPLQAEPAQTYAPIYYLMPDGSTPAQLQTHTADIRIVDGSSNSADGSTVAFAGRFRLKNETETTLTVPLVLTPARGNGPDSTQGTTIALTVDGAPVALQAGTDGLARGEVRIPSEASVDLRLESVALMPPGSLVTVGYDARLLAAWPGLSSLRTTIYLPAAIDPDSWVRVAPDDWRYAAKAAPDEVGIQWLYDGARPTEPFIVQFLTPALWAALAADADAADAGDLAAWKRQGDGYRQIYSTLSAAADDEHAPVSARFYAQAVAAYTAGLNEAAGGLVHQVVPFHAGLAALYRQRAFHAGRVDLAYTALMVQAATEALNAMQPIDDRRAELTQWQADGLRQLLADAQQRGDWTQVTALLDQIARLPEPPLSPEAVAEARRVTTVLQALVLLEAGQREAAVTLAGAELNDPDLQPDADFLSLFSSWQITATITADNMTVTATAQPAVGQEAAAGQALTTLINGWETLPASDKRTVQLTSPLPTDGARSYSLHIELDDRDAALTLAQGTDPGPQWVLLRTLLSQLMPVVRTQEHLLRRTIDLEQSLDLRAAQTQWTTMAENLSETATQIEFQGGGANLNDPAAIEFALRERIRAANARHAAETWRALATNSWVATRLTPASEAEGRIWLATASTPTVTYQFQATASRWPQIWGMAGILLIVLFAASTLLWRLL